MQQAAGSRQAASCGAAGVSAVSKHGCHGPGVCAARTCRYKDAVTECSAALEGQPNFFKALVS